jgi:hypothetical protein
LSERKDNTQKKRRYKRGVSDREEEKIHTDKEREREGEREERRVIE